MTNKMINKMINKILVIKFQIPENTQVIFGVGTLQKNNEISTDGGLGFGYFDGENEYHASREDIIKMISAVIVEDETNELIN